MKLARALMKPLGFLIPLIVFMVVYNRVVVDVNLKNLQLSLKVLSDADAVSKAEAAMVLIDQNLLYTVSLAEPDASELAALQHVRGSLGGEAERSVDDAQVIVSSLLDQKLQARGGLMGTLDDLNDAVQGAIQRVQLLPRAVLKKKQLSDEVDLAKLNQAITYEKLGELLKAEQIYITLLKTYPEYEGSGDLKLRLGYLYQRQRQLAKAKQMYQEVARATADPVELGITRQLLARLAAAQEMSQKLKQLRSDLLHAVDVEARQKALFDLGTAQMRLFDFDEALKNLKLAAEVRPKAPLAAQARFRQAWCLKYVGRIDEAMALFQNLSAQEPGGTLSTSAQVQIADAYRATGQYEAATASLEAAIDQAEDIALASVLTAQAGLIYLFDLKEPEKAKASFQKIEQVAPASDLVEIKEEIERVQLRKAMVAAEKELQKAATQGAAPGAERVGFKLPGVATPVVGILEVTVFGYVDVATRRLANAMKDAGERELSRRFTEADLKNQAIRRIEQRFPQIKQTRIQIGTEGFSGSATVRVGPVSVPVYGKARIDLVDRKPNIRMLELSIGKVPIPAIFLQMMDNRVNQKIRQAKLPLNIDQFTFQDGAVDVRMSLAE